MDRRALAAYTKGDEQTFKEFPIWKHTQHVTHLIIEASLVDKQ